MFETSTQTGAQRGGSLRVESVRKRYGRLEVLRGISFVAPEAAVTVVLGESGAGKTTIGEIVAGTLRPDAGAIWLGEREVTSWPANKRRIALAPQEWELFAHLSALENIAFGAWAAGVPRRQRLLEAAEWLAAIGLEAKANSLPMQLSGGQQQRVALARALAAPGPFAVLDEPFANVDQASREPLRMLVQRVTQTGKGVIIITHDRQDALMLAEWIICVENGLALQDGSPEEVFMRPASLAAARLVGTPPASQSEIWFGP